MKNIRWGILGFGKTSERFIKGLALTSTGSFVAAASRTADKQTYIHEHYPNVVIYSDYTELLSQANVDAIYITLRHEDHFKWAKAALLSGKAVLCEKPATLTLAQTKELCDIAHENNVFFLEALKTRFLPLTLKLHELIETKVVGDLVHMENAFCYTIPYQANSYLFDLKQGGILYDVGSYTLGNVLDFIKSPLKELSVHVEKNYGVDVYDEVKVTFESGQSALVKMAMDRSLPRDCTMICTQGKIYIESFHRPEKLVVEDLNGNVTVYEGHEDDFVGQIEAVHQGILDQRFEDDRMSHFDSQSIVSLFEVIRAKYPI